MPEPEPTQSPPPPPPISEPAAATATSASTGLPTNIAATLACIPLVGGIIFYVLEKHDGFVRFYAMQSIIFGGAWVLFVIVYSIAHAILTPIPALGLIFRVMLAIVWALVGIAFLIIFIITMVKAFNGVRWEIPYLGAMARKQAGQAA